MTDGRMEGQMEMRANSGQGGQTSCVNLFVWLNSSSAHRQTLLLLLERTLSLSLATKSYLPPRDYLSEILPYTRPSQAKPSEVKQICARVRRSEMPSQGETRSASLCRPFKWNLSAKLGAACEGACKSQQDQDSVCQAQAQAWTGTGTRQTQCTQSSSF